VNEYLHTHTRVHVHMYLRIYIYIYVYIYIYIYRIVCTHAYIHTYALNGFIVVCTHIHPYALQRKDMLSNRVTHNAMRV
jgi:hypothetical protein